MSDNFVHPFLEQGKLTCPQCGQAGMPANRTRCWHCGVSFAEPTHEKPIKLPVAAQEAAPEQPIDTEAVPERTAETGAAAARKSAPSQWQRRDPLRGLPVLILICAIAAGLCSFFPMCTWEISHDFFIVDMDALTIVLSVACAVISPILAGISVSNESVLQQYRLLSFVRMTLFCSGGCALATYSYFYNRYCKGAIYPVFSATVFFWICVGASVLGILLACIAVARIRDEAKN